MLKIIENDIYYKNVKVATFNSQLVPSFRDEAEEIFKNNFYDENEIEEIKNAAIEEALKQEAECAE